MFKVRSKMWGELTASWVGSEDGFLIMNDVCRDGKPFHPSCWIPVTDVLLVVPPEVKS